MPRCIMLETIHCAEPIPAEIRYLRLVLKAPVPNQSWSNQIAGIEIER